MGFNPYYTFSVNVWIFYGFLLLVIVAEAVCYFCANLAPVRGILFMVLEGFVIFHTDISNFADKVFYPYIGSEYRFLLLVITAMF